MVEDGKALEDLMSRFLRAVSFEAGTRPACDALREVFVDRFSTYTERGTLGETVIDARGAISTQFIRTAEGWRMSSMAWDDERPGVELSARYLA
jgi:riboflavin biosynthesis pyrimidine reductase